jgi:putrescine aminotransferase
VRRWPLDLVEPPPPEPFGRPAAEVFDAIRRHVAPGLALGHKVLGSGAYEVEAGGATVRLSDGRELIDFGSYAVTLLGHRHPAVVAAVAAQLTRMPTSTRGLANPVVAAFVEELASLGAPALSRVWLGSDGADAVEVALKLARRRTGRMRVLAVEGAFHGKTLGALAATAGPAFRTGLEPLLQHVTHVSVDEPDAVEREAQAGDVAALILEPIQGEGGVRPLPEDVVLRWTAAARAAGAYVICDEIQVGLRRCGPMALSVSRGWQPDAVLFGKALGGGVMPLAAMVATEDLHAPLAADPTWHTATFGGHPLACAAGRAALQTLEQLEDAGRHVGETIAKGLRDRAAQHPGVVAEVRGQGLLLGVQFTSPAAAGAALVEMAERGLLVSPCLSALDTIRFLPPIVTSDEQAERALDIFAAGLVAAEDFSAPRPATLEEDALRARVRALILEVAPIKPAEMTGSLALIADLDYDSLNVIELIALVEHELDVAPVTEEQAAEVETVADVEELVLGLIAAAED